MYDYMKSLQRHFETKPEYIQDLKAEVNQTHKELSTRLSKEDRRLLLELVDLEDTLRGEATLHSFVSGYRLACGINRELSEEQLGIRGREGEFALRQVEIQFVLGADFVSRRRKDIGQPATLKEPVGPSLFKRVVSASDGIKCATKQCKTSTSSEDLSHAA